MALQKTCRENGRFRDHPGLLRFWYVCLNAPKWDKPPLIARLGTPASSANPDTWTRFEATLDAYQRDQYDGIGVVVTEANEIAGVDLDHCRDLHTGAITPWAQAIVDRMHTYTEVSPSGTGLRLFLNGTRPKKGRRKGAIEIYSWGRYLTITGHHLEGTNRVTTLFTLVRN